LLLDFLKNRLKKAVEGFRLGTPGLRETLGTLSSPRDRLCTFVRLRVHRRCKPVSRRREGHLSVVVV